MRQAPAHAELQRVPGPRPAKELLVPAHPVGSSLALAGGSTVPHQHSKALKTFVHEMKFMKTKRVFGGGKMTSFRGFHLSKKDVGGIGVFFSIWIIGISANAQTAPQPSLPLNHIGVAVSQEVYRALRETVSEEGSPLNSCFRSDGGGRERFFIHTRNDGFEIQTAIEFANFWRDRRERDQSHLDPDLATVGSTVIVLTAQGNDGVEAAANSLNLNNHKHLWRDFWRFGDQSIHLLFPVLPRQYVAPLLYLTVMGVAPEGNENCPLEGISGFHIEGTDEVQAADVSYRLGQLGMGAVFSWTAGDRIREFEVRFQIAANEEIDLTDRNDAYEMHTEDGELLLRIRL